MRNTLLFLLIVFSLTCNAQNTMQQNNLVPVYYHSYHNEVQPMDSLIEDVLVYNTIDGPYNLETRSYKTYSKQRKYQLNEKKVLLLDFFGDTTILYREYAKDPNDELITPKSSGELRINKNNVNSIVDVEGISSFGEDSLIYDSIYPLFPNGIWSINIDDKTFETGSFKNGQKDGIWHVINTEYFLRHFTPIISTSIYEDGKLISSKKVDLSQTNENIPKIICGEWFNVGQDNTDKTFCRLVNGKCSMFFVRDSSQCDKSYDSSIDYMNLQKNNKLEFTTSVRCASTGPSDYPKESEKRWKVLDNHTLVIMGIEYNIEYLTDNELIISFK
ncbi:MAG: hypothetical protein ABI207_04520 [Crocinitomicaceae bacterium]